MGKRKLRVGLLLDDFNIPVWSLKMIENDKKLIELSTLTRMGLAALFSAALLSTGCARIAGTKGKGPESVQANNAQISRSGWGPIVGDVREPKEPRIVLVSESSLRTSPSLFSTGHTSVTSSEPRSASSGKHSAPIADEVESNPFHHPAAKNPLPKVMPRMDQIEVAPLPDRLSQSVAATPSSAPSGETAVAPQASVPSSLAINQGIPQHTVPAPVASTAQARTTESQPRARLADPNVPSPKLKTAPAESPKSQSINTSTLAGVSSQDMGGIGKYRFSFSREIWLLIIILGGVFATLWFRLEYDFGSRARRGRRRR